MAQRRKNTPGPNAQLEMWRALLSLQLRVAFSAVGNPTIGNGTTAGRLATTVAVDYTVAGASANRAIADDFWNLSGETATTASQYRAYWLYVNLAGTASFVAGSNAPSEALALAALPTPADDQSIFGTYVAGPSTDFSAALVAQGTVTNGIPTGAFIGIVGNKTYIAPQGYDIVRS